MVTKQQLLRSPQEDLHRGECRRIVGPRGGVRIVQEVWRRNGRVQVWATRPHHFTAPLKYGLYQYGFIDHNNAGEFHMESECPLYAEMAQS